MPSRSSRQKKPHDSNRLATSIAEMAAGNEPEAADLTVPEKNPAAVALGKLGGKKGGQARAVKLSAARRSEIARKAAQTRWHGEQETR